MEILAVQNLSFTYPDGEKKVLDDVSLRVQEGEFLLLCGRSGCGKTTFLKLLKRELAPHGEKKGEILFEGVEQEKLDARTAAAAIGYVLQSPEAQIVTDKVWHELAFGLESLGFSTDEIRLRVGEMANYFGINAWFQRETATLSGGQKQLLNLASVMALAPKMLLLDEPTSQLDPIAASNFIHTLQKLNREMGITVILAEHHLEEAFPIADRIAVMDEGHLIACDKPRRVCQMLAGHPIAAGFPSAVRIYAGLPLEDAECPLTVREGRNYLSAFPKRQLPIADKRKEIQPVLSMKGVWFRYERHAPDILRGVNLEVDSQEIFTILGGNGSGKTTALKVLSGIGKAYRGKTVLLGKNLKEYRQTDLHHHAVALLPQNVQTVFLKKTLKEDLADICRVMAYSRTETEEKIHAVCEKLNITALLERHPYDLSGGEMQKGALAKMLLTEPKILLLDEPTKGIDAYAKQTLREIFRQLQEDGMTILMVTHDVEFAAAVSDRCALFFNGEVLSPSTPQIFFGKNHFYTTAASRISRGIFENTVTPEEVIMLGREP